MKSSTTAHIKNLNLRKKKKITKSILRIYLTFCRFHSLPIPAKSKIKNKNLKYKFNELKEKQQLHDVIYQL